MTEHSLRHLLGPTSILSLSAGLLYASSFATIPILPPYMVAQGIEVPLVGLALMAFPITRLLLQAPIGFLSDVYGRKSFITVGCAAYVLVFISLLFASSFWEFLLIKALQGFASAATFTALMAMIVDLTEEAEMGRAFTDISLITYIGSSGRRKTSIQALTSIKELPKL